MQACMLVYMYVLFLYGICVCKHEKMHMRRSPLNSLEVKSSAQVDEHMLGSGLCSLVSWRATGAFGARLSETRIEVFGNLNRSCCSGRPSYELPAILRVVDPYCCG